MKNSQPSRIALIAWTIAAVAGTAAVWWLSSYLETLSDLAQRDRVAALGLFRTRAMPALLAVVLVAVGSGGLLLRQGLHMARAADDQGRMLGRILAAAGFLLAALPLALISVVFWLLRRA